MTTNNSKNSLRIQHFSPTIAEKGFNDLPEMIPVRQRFPQDSVQDIKQAVINELSRFSKMDLQGKRIAVTAGSRGINGMVETLQTTVSQLQEWDAEPFIVPAMGSHGGATAEGQLAVLNNLGISESSVGAPIRSSMEVVELGIIHGETRVCCDRLAFESDGIVVCNRIKAHTGFAGDYESGLLKMMVIGLGKHAGTNSVHRLGFSKFHQVIPEAAAIILDKAPILFGVGLIENAYNQVAAIEAIPTDSIFEREKQLLKYAKSIMGRILVSDIDLLIVDELGKEISGGGMDSNITGRAASGVARPEAPAIQRIVLRDLSQKTAGNALGMGMADLICMRAVEKIHLAPTYTNSLTAGALLASKLPIIAATDRDAIDLACKSMTGLADDGLRIVHIRNTKDLENIWLSTAYASEITEREELVQTEEARPCKFDDSGNMVWPTER